MYLKSQKSIYYQKIIIAVLLLFITVLNSNNITIINKQNISPGSFIEGNTGIIIGNSHIKDIKHSYLYYYIKPSNDIEKISIHVDEVRLKLLDTKYESKIYMRKSLKNISIVKKQIIIKDDMYDGDITFHLKNGLKVLKINALDSDINLKLRQNKILIIVNGDSKINIKNIKNVSLNIKGDSEVFIDGIKNLKVHFLGDFILINKGKIENISIIGKGDVDMYTKNKNYSLNKNIEGDFNLYVK